MTDLSRIILPTLVREDEIIMYFGKKVKSGYYSDIFDLLDDFSIIIYPQLNQYHHSENFSLLKDVANRIRTYILHYHTLFETEPDTRVLFDNMWRYNFKLPYAKRCIKTICPGITLTPDGSIKDFVVKDQTSSIKPFRPLITEKQQCPSFDIPSRAATDSDLISIYEDSSNMYIAEDRILWVFGTLLHSGKWSDAYSFIGCIMFVLKNQNELLAREKKYVPYKVLTPLKNKIRVICSTYLSEISGSDREEIIDGLVKLWHKRYSLFTIRNILKIFAPECKVSEEGEILFP